MQEADCKDKVRRLQEEHLTVVAELKNKIMEYKERLKLEEQKRNQADDFDFNDDDLAKINVENETLARQNKALADELREAQREKQEAEQEAKKAKRSSEALSQQVAESRRHVEELRAQCNKLEMANELLKQSGGAGVEKVEATALKQFSDLEKKYIQTKRYVLLSQKYWRGAESLPAVQAEAVAG